MSTFPKLIADESGAALPEYSLILALFSLIAVTSLGIIAGLAETALENAYTNFQALQETPPL